MTSRKVMWHSMSCRPKGCSQDIKNRAQGIKHQLLDMDYNLKYMTERYLAIRKNHAQNHCPLGKSPTRVQITVPTRKIKEEIPRTDMGRT